MLNLYVWIFCMLSHLPTLTITKMLWNLWLQAMNSFYRSLERFNGGALKRWSRLLQLDGQLGNWHEVLLEHLNSNLNNDTYMYVHTHTQILQMQYHSMVWIMLYPEIYVAYKSAANRGMKNWRAHKSLFLTWIALADVAELLRHRLTGGRTDRTGVVGT